MLLTIPPELHITVLTYLRATDLSSLQQTCTTFSNRSLTQNIITAFATEIYPPELTRGYDTPVISEKLPSMMEDKPTYEILRNMEMLIVARVLSRPEPSLNERNTAGCFYVSKAWCKTALKWLEVQEEQRKARFMLKVEAAKAADEEANGNNIKGKKKHQQKGKREKKVSRQERRKNRKLSDTLPPWPNVNHDITCEHGCLKQNNNNNNNEGSRSSRAKRRLMDKQAWKVLKKLYPEGIQLSTLQGECIQCTMEFETKKRNEEMKKQKEKEERRKPLQNDHVRSFFNRTKGVPKECLIMPEGEYESSFMANMSMLSGKKSSANCPLRPGIYYVLPRSWCYRFRKYIKNGEGNRPCAPETSLCLCDAHKLPLIPPHLESFLYGETSSLLGTSIDLVISFDGGHDDTETAEIPLQAAVGLSSPLTTNIRTIHDLISPSRSISSTSSSSTMTPRSFPVGYNPVDRRLGGRSLSNSGSHMDMMDSSQNQRAHGRSNIGINRASLTAHITPQSQPADEDISTLRATGLSESDIQLQRLAMMQIEEERTRQQRRMEEEAERRRQYQQALQNQNPISQSITSSSINLMSPEDIRANLNAKLDRENNVVVEILTDYEYSALEECWPEIHSSYALKFAIIEDDRKGTDIVWTTNPCRACDASGSNHDFVVRNRCRNWVNATPKKKKK